MSSRILVKNYVVFCPRPECRSTRDTFRVSYKVEEDETGKLKAVKEKGVADPTLKIQEPLPQGWTWVERCCPWCNQISTFRVPL